MKMSLTPDLGQKLNSETETDHPDSWQFRKKWGCQGLRDTSCSSLGHDLKRSVRHESNSVHEWLLQCNQSCLLRPQVPRGPALLAALCSPELFSSSSCNAITYLLRRGEKGWRGRGTVGCHTKACAGRTGLGSITPKGKSPGCEAQGSSVCCCCTPLPLPDPDLGEGEAEGAAWKHPNLLSESKRPAAVLRTEHHPPLGKN